MRPGTQHARAGCREPARAVSDSISLASFSYKEQYSLVLAQQISKVCLTDGCCMQGALRRAAAACRSLQGARTSAQRICAGCRKPACAASCSHHRGYDRGAAWLGCADAHIRHPPHRCCISTSSTCVRGTVQLSALLQAAKLPGCALPPSDCNYLCEAVYSLDLT